MANLRIKLVKSLNKKIGSETVQPDNPQTRGKIAQISYLISVTEE